MQAPQAQSADMPLKNKRRKCHSLRNTRSIPADIVYEQKLKCSAYHRGVWHILLYILTTNSYNRSLKQNANNKSEQ